MKFLLVLLLSTLSFSSYSQQPTFEATVNYLNDIFKENQVLYLIGTSGRGWPVTSINCKNDGKVTLSQTNSISKESVIVASFNLFDVASWDTSRNASTNKSGDVLAQFSGLPEDTFKRMTKAFDHLRTLCNKNADPFAN